MLLPNLVRRGAIISFIKNSKGTFGFAHATGPNDSLMKWMAQSQYNALNLNEVLTPQKQLKVVHWTNYEASSRVAPIHLALIDYWNDNQKFFGRIDFGQEQRIGFYSHEQLDRLIPIEDKQVHGWLFANFNKINKY